MSYGICGMYPGPGLILRPNFIWSESNDFNYKIRVMFEIDYVKVPDTKKSVTSAIVSLNVFVIQWKSIRNMYY